MDPLCSPWGVSHFQLRMCVTSNPEEASLAALAQRTRHSEWRTKVRKGN